MRNQEKRNYVKAQQEIAHLRMLEYRKRKDEEFRENNKMRLNSEKKKIKDKEYEAQHLEMYEAELLHRLQATQKLEREAFTQLESAMIDSSLPKKTSKTS